MSGVRVLLVDNHDSFTYNLAQYLGELGAAVEVAHSDRIEVAGVDEGRCDAIVVSPGPGRPEAAGISVPLVRERAGVLPILGVCLGHQAIVAAFGGGIGSASELVHGKTSPVRHDGLGVFQGLDNPFDAARYHSLAADPASLPDVLVACAFAPDGTILGIRHRSLSVHGVQFHPESILTPQGLRLLGNFLSLARAGEEDRPVSARVMVKVCGITEERDAQEAVHLGVDALGFDFRPDSPRYVEPALVHHVVSRLPVFVSTVGVFADLPLIRVLDTARRAGVGILQFSGKESPSTCAGSAPYPWVRSFRVGPEFDENDLSYYATTTYLLDARGDDGRSTDPPFEWRRARALSMYGRIVIAGNLEPAHIALAIDDARPYGVDLLSEVEIAPGKKDLDRLELLMEAVRRAERRITNEG